MNQLVIPSRLEQEYLLGIVEAAVQVRNARDFYLWAQGPLQALLPHELMLCLQFEQDGALRGLEAVHASLLDAALLARVGEPQAGLAVRLARHCLGADGLPAMAERDGAGSALLAPFRQELDACGFDNLLLHASGALPGPRTVFLLFGLPMKPGPRHQYFLALLLPQLHLAVLRQMEAGMPARTRAVGAAPTRRALSARECEILQWLQEGKRNAEIGAILGLSPLTVKNHLQRIYQLLGARNRTEAVQRCSALRLLPPQRETTGQPHLPA